MRGTSTCRFAGRTRPRTPSLPATSARPEIVSPSRRVVPSGCAASSLRKPIPGNRSHVAGGLRGDGLARVPNTRPRSQAQNQVALADRTYLMALARLEVDQAWRGERPLACPSAYEQLPTRDENEGVLVNLMLLQALALGQQQRNHAVGLVIGTKDLRLVSRDTQPI